MKSHRTIVLKEAVVGDQDNDEEYQGLDDREYDPDQDFGKASDPEGPYAGDGYPTGVK
ncbi:hypothetical protein [Streptomyces sp. NPDC053079]|uniref:hypothetical protein n=1 Tax=Streptomyces sp. NPDC053079 TaxID=3365697 RepID=UPI0037D6B9D3